VIFTAFKAVDSVLRGPNGGFDSHTLPPKLEHRATANHREHSRKLTFSNGKPKSSVTILFVNCTIG
jgi:hypothetical protein